jgi:hypothetical protein
MRGIQLGFWMVVLLGVTACGGTSSNGSGGNAGAGGRAGTGGSAGTGGIPFEPPVDQCINDADQAIFDELGDEVGVIAASCGIPPGTPCGGQIGTVYGGDRSPAAAMALSDCIAQCVSDETALSTGCTSCYGLITTCTIDSPCLAPCATDPGSAECATCSTEACGFLDACLGI